MAGRDGRDEQQLNPQGGRVRPSAPAPSDACGIVPAMATMERRSWDRYSPLAGVAAVILWVIGVVISESGDAPTDDESAQGVLNYFTEDESQIMAGEITFAIGVLFFIWFLGSLRSHLFAHEPSGHYTALAYGSGLLASVAMLIGAAVLIQPSFLDDGDLSAEAAQALAQVSDAMFGVVELTLVVTLLATAIVILRTRALPRWLGWASLALAVLLLIIPIGWIGVIFGVPLWTLATSVLLFMRQPGTAEAAPGPARV